MYKKITFNLIIFINLAFSSILAQNNNFETPEITLNSNVSQFIYSEDNSTLIYYGEENIIHFINNQGQEVRSIHSVNDYGKITHGIEKGGVFYFLTSDAYLMKIDFGINQYSEVHISQYRNSILSPYFERGKTPPLSNLVSLNNDSKIYLILPYSYPVSVGNTVYTISPGNNGFTNLTINFPPIFGDLIYDNVAFINNTYFNNDEIIFEVESAPSSPDDGSGDFTTYWWDVRRSLYKIKNGLLISIPVPEDINKHRRFECLGFSLNERETTWYFEYNNTEDEEYSDGEYLDFYSGTFSIKNNKIIDLLNNETSDFDPSNYYWDENDILKRTEYNGNTYFIDDEEEKIFTLNGNEAVSFPFNVVSMTPVESKGAFGPLLFLGKKTRKIENSDKYDNKTILYELYGNIWFESGITTNPTSISMRGDKLYLAGNITNPNNGDKTFGIFTWTNRTLGLVYESESEYFEDLNVFNNDLFFSTGLGSYYRVKYKNTLGLETNQLENKIRIFPNPASDIINVNFFNTIPKAKVIIFNISGKLILLKEIDDNFNQINISELSKGIYFMKIETNETTVTKKVIKN
jgi:hypothetical protein